MSAKIKDVAERAGVSNMAVSVVLRGQASHVRVSDATRARILEAAQEMGYQPHGVARSLRTRRTDTVALITAGFDNPFHNSIIENAEHLLVQAKRQMLVIDAGANSFGTRTGGALPASLPVDGALMWADHHQNAGTYLGAQAERIPIVYLGAKRLTPEDAVFFDLEDGAYQAVRHLFERGRNRPAFVYPSFGPEWHLSDARYNGFQRACADYGGEPSVLLLDAPREDPASGRRLGLEIASRPPLHRPDALFCLNDAIAIGVYHGLRRGGLRVPDDIALVGFDGIREGALLDRPLTTVKTSPEDLCRVALEILSQRIDGRDDPVRQEVLPVALRIGETT